MKLCRISSTTPKMQNEAERRRTKMVTDGEFSPGARPLTRGGIDVLYCVLVLIRSFNEQYTTISL